MNVLDEIFKNNTHLLQEPKVKELLAYVQKQHAINYQKIRNQNFVRDKIMDLVFNSEVVVIKGRPMKEVIEEIIEII